MKYVNLVGKNTHKMLTSYKFVTEKSRHSGNLSKLAASLAPAPYGEKQTEAGYPVHPV